MGALWARICSRRHAWINSVSAESRLLTSPQMELARPTGQSINRKTKRDAHVCMDSHASHAPIQESSRLDQVPRCDDGCLRVLSHLFRPVGLLGCFRRSDLSFGSYGGSIA